MRPFTADDYAARLQRGAANAREGGFDGLLIAPGPDLAYFIDYLPVAVTERITLLVIPAEGDPSMVVPPSHSARAAFASSTGRTAPTSTFPPPGCLRRTDTTRSRIRPGRCTCSGSSRSFRAHASKR
jgi:hypothetical protein